MDIQIRPYTTQDAVALSALFYRSVTQLAGRAYTRAQVEVWAAQTPSPARMHALASDGRLVLVAVSDGHLAAYADLEADGHVDHLYADPRTAGKGITSALYQAIEAAAQKQGIAMLYTEASELAKPFFLKKGYVLGKKRNLRLMGVDIHNYAMTKSIGEQTTG